jgi:hypothetical protein
MLKKIMTANIQGEKPIYYNIICPALPATRSFDPDESLLKKFTVVKACLIANKIKMVV